VTLFWHAAFNSLVRAREVPSSRRPGRRVAIGLLALSGTIAFAGGTAAAPGSIELALHVNGDVSGDIQTRRDLDASHSCALVGPSGREQTLVLAFNKSQTDSLLGVSDFGFSLSIPGTVGQSWDENQPSTILQLSIGNRRFVGLRAVDAQFHLLVSVDPAGGKGTFSANHLLDQSTGAAIDVRGAWHCFSEQVTAAAGPAALPDVGQRVPENASGVSASAAPRAPHPDTGLNDRPTPARAEGAAASKRSDGDPSGVAPAEASPPRRFRLYHLESCRGSACDSWMAIDASSAQVSEASVDFAHLKLAAPLMAHARAGLIELWITGAARRSVSGLQISALHLDGIVPRQGGTVRGKSLFGR